MCVNAIEWKIGSKAQSEINEWGECRVNEISESVALWVVNVILLNKLRLHLKGVLLYVCEITWKLGIV